MNEKIKKKGLAFVVSFLYIVSLNVSYITNNLKICLKTKLIILLFASLFASLFAFKCSQEAPQSKIKNAIENLNPSFQIAVDSLLAPVVIDSLYDPAYELKTIRFLGVDNKTGRTFYEVTYKKREETE